MKLDAEGDLVHELGGSRRRGLIIAAVVLALLGAGGFLVYRAWQRGKRRALVHAARAWQRWEGCMVGAPLQGETATARVRLIMMGVHHARGEQPVGDAAWPRRCAPHLGELARAIAGAKVDFQSPLRKLQVDAERIADLLAPFSLATGKLPDDLDALWVSARAAGLDQLAQAPEAKRDAPLPMRAALRADAMQPLEKYLALEDTEINADGSFEAVFRRRVGTRERLMLCAIAAPPGGGRCRELAEGVPSDRATHVLLGTAPDLGRPLVRIYDADAGGNGVWDGATGALLWPDSAFHSTLGHGVALDDGFLALGHVGEARVDVVRWKDGAAVTETAQFKRDPFWVWQWGRQLAWGEPDPQSGRLHLYARPLATAPPLLGPVIDIGELPPPRDHLPHRSCESRDDLVIVHRPASANDLVDPVSVITFAHAGAWSAPVPLPLTPSTDWYRLDCNGARASIMWNGPGEVFQLRCSPGACEPVDAVATEGIPTGTWMGDLDGQALAVWDEAGLVFFRLAPLHQLDAAPDRLLTDDAAHGGLDGDVDALYIRGATALVLIEDHAGGGTYAVRITPDGKVAAVPVTP